MTIWAPELKRSGLPLYREIADALAEDIGSGRLPPSSRLPTHRDLAWRLQVTVGTVSRAYAEAERRGLIGGAVGRGTFVLPAGSAPSPAPDASGMIDLSLNYAIAGVRRGCFRPVWPSWPAKAISGRCFSTSRMPAQCRIGLQAPLGAAAPVSPMPNRTASS